MATRPLPEATGPPSAPYIEELHEFFVTSRVPFGSPADLEPMVARMREPGAFSEDLSSLLRSFILRQRGEMPHAQLLEILTVAIAGHEPIDSPQQYSEPLRQLLGFVAAVMRRPWNAPPGERTEVLPFPDVLAAPGPALDPVTAATARPAPTTPTPAPPLPIPPPQDIPEPSPPPSAIAVALAESMRMAEQPEPAVESVAAPPAESLAGFSRRSRRSKRVSLSESRGILAQPEPAPTAETMRTAAVEREPVEREPRTMHAEPVLFLRAADVPRPEPEPDRDPTFDPGLDRPSPVFRSVLVAAALAAAFAAFFVFSGRKPADILRVHPLAAFARLESMVHRPSTPQPNTEQSPASPSLTVPNPPPENLPPAPQPPASATAQPEGTDSSAESPQPPAHSAYVKPLHHPDAATASSYADEPLPKPASPKTSYPKAVYPEPNPPTPIPAPPVNAPAVAARPAPAAPPQPAASTAAPSRSAASGATPPSNPNQYAPYQPSTTDATYAPYHPNSNSTRSPEQTVPAEPPAQSPPQSSAPHTELQSPAQTSAPTVSELRTPDRSLATDGIGLGMTPGGPPHRPLSEPSREIQPSFYSVSSHVMEANLISSPGPDYPAYARATHVQGQVTMEAVIDKQGAVSSIRILTGHHLLREAAEDAVRRWRYRPYIVNGQPVEVATIVTVEFHNPT